jgi:hypothetical protein
MRPGSIDIVFRRIGADHLRTQPRQRLRQDAAAATDIQHAQAFQTVQLFWIAVELRRGLVADIAEPNGIELVQGRHGAARIPPIGGMT